MNIIIENDTKLGIPDLIHKQCFVGISLGSLATVESGIAVLDRNLNLLRVDKAFNLNDVSQYIKNLGPASSMIICVDLPKSAGMLNGKWRQEAKNISILKLNKYQYSKQDWIERFSDRGIELCNSLSTLGIDVFRYYSYFTKNMLNLNSPFKSRTPVACKHLQMSIKNNLKISGIPSNLIALSGLEAIIGAYTCWRVATQQENAGYKIIGDFKNTPIITAV